MAVQIQPTPCYAISWRSSSSQWTQLSKREVLFPHHNGLQGAVWWVLRWVHPCHLQEPQQNPRDPRPTSQSPSYRRIHPAIRAIRHDMIGSLWTDLQLSLQFCVLSSSTAPLKPAIARKKVAEGSLSIVGPRAWIHSPCSDSTTRDLMTCIILPLHVHTFVYMLWARDNAIWCLAQWIVNKVQFLTFHSLLYILIKA